MKTRILAFLLIAFLPAAGQDANSRPDIVIFLSDDHGQLDSTVTAAQIDVLAGALTKAARVERLNLPASAHLVAIDRDRDLLRDRVIGFLQSL